ncbi:MAG: glycosyltransferase family 2 protein [Spongiibacteraceae bacterium]
MNKSIIAVVVTYNRKNLLLKCLEGLIAQSVPLSRIILIDNASTDGTKELLDKSSYASNSLLNYHLMPTNTGGAGGFHEGMRQAMQHEPAWIWVMDDDVSPEPDALEQLLKYTSISECIHPSRVLEDGSYCEWEHVFDPATTAKLFLNDISFKNGKEFCFAQTACFEGMLISSRLVKKIGLPRKEFFIVEDDTLYGFLASLHTNVLYVRSAQLKKLLTPPVGLSPFKAYYAARNKIWLHKILKREGLLDRGAIFRFNLYYPFYILLLILNNPTLSIIRSAGKGVIEGLKRHPEK